MADRVRITDVSPRDGLQNEPGVIEAERKVRLIELLAASGVDEIEATSFVSPKWVPQLADASEVMQAVQERAFRDRPRISVLVPNRKGFERAQAFHSESSPLKIAVFTAASETFSERNTNASISEAIARFGEFVPDALEAGMRVRLYISCAVACPYEGRIDPSEVRAVAHDLLSLAPPSAIERGDVELDLGDTIGAAAPEDIARLLTAFSEQERAPLVLHLHDTHGRASACVKAALDLGVRAFDGSAGGLGGCPYAGTKAKPAPGNISTDTLVRTVHGAGCKTGVDLEALARASAYARELLAEARGGAAS